MALARVHVWNAGDLLKAADLNGEFNSILNNPISLISPTTGVITFTTAQTFLVSQLSSGPLASSALTSGTIAGGSILYYSTAATPLLDTLAIGSSNQVFAVTSSNSPPSWRNAEFLTPQTLFFNSFNVSTGGSTGYFGASGIDVSSPSNVGIVMPSSGVLSKLRVTHSASPAGAATFTITVFIAGVVTTMQTVVTGGNIFGTDLTTNLTVNAGDTVAMRFQSNTTASDTRTGSSLLLLRSS